MKALLAAKWSPVRWGSQMCLNVRWVFIFFVFMQQKSFIILSSVSVFYNERQRSVINSVAVLWILAWATAMEFIILLCSVFSF
jgi:hypothetical protein